jgi:peptidoglycan/xylan/chitin deacetylase (PgdA/CDA1 family)
LDDPFTFHETEKLGYVVIKWSVSSRDWERPGPGRIYDQVMRHVQNGSIILLHDGDKLHHGGNRSQTVAVLPQLIHDLRAQGYKLVTIPELLYLEPPQLAEANSHRS